MPLDAGELRRGRIVYAIYPFACDFPRGVRHEGSWVTVDTIEEYAALRRGRPTELKTEVRLRPILLLHDGTRGEHDDVVCLRVNTVKPGHMKDTATWRRIRAHEHPFFFHLPAGHGSRLPAESVIALASLGTVNKSAILGPRHIGELSVREMQVISERLRLMLSLDLAPQIARQALDLLRRAGLLKG